MLRCPMNPERGLLLALLLMQVCFTCSCARRQVTEEEAEQAALAQIEEAQAAFAYDAKRLPRPSMRRVPDGFDFEVRDEVQNVLIYVHVSPTGLPEISAITLDQDRRLHEEGVAWAAARRATRVCTFGTDVHVPTPHDTKDPLTPRQSPLGEAPSVQPP